MRNDQIVICPSCDHIQEEFNVPVDKFSWQCKNCTGVFENGAPHLLQREARFTSDAHRSVCTGFGARAGEIRHKIIEAASNQRA